MTKPYSDRQMKVKQEPEPAQGEVYFFPKANPPVSVRAKSLEEAERIVKALRVNKK